MEIHTEIEPLESRKEKLTLKFLERATRTDIDFLKNDAVASLSLTTPKYSYNSFC